MFVLWGKKYSYGGVWIKLLIGTSRECGRELSGRIAEGGWDLAIAMQGHKPGE